MKEYPRLSDLYIGAMDLRKLEISDTEFRQFVVRECQRKKGFSLDNEEDERSYFCEIANIANPGYEVAFFIDYRLLGRIGTERISCEYKICGYFSSGYCCYRAVIEHLVDEKGSRMRIDSNEVWGDENENHGIGSAGLNVITSLARKLRCTEIYGKAQLYPVPEDPVVYAEAKKRLRYFYGKNGFVFDEVNESISRKL